LIFTQGAIGDLKVIESPHKRRAVLTEEWRADPGPDAFEIKGASKGRS